MEDQDLSCEVELHYLNIIEMNFRFWEEQQILASCSVSSVQTFFVSFCYIDLGRPTFLAEDHNSYCVLVLGQHVYNSQ